jgi:Cu-processing system permease protein
MSEAIAVAPPRSTPRLSFGALALITRKELRDSLRNRWFLLYTIAFATLAVSLAYVSVAGTGAAGFAGFGRTAAGLINLVVLIVPLMALTSGATAIAGEREHGTLAYLLSQPVTRLEVLLGKYLGLSMSLLASITIGFGSAAGLIAYHTGGADASRFLSIVAIAYMLGLAMLSVGIFISTMTRRSSVAVGTAIFVWLTLVFISGLGLMGSAVAFRLEVDELFHLALVNPIEVFRMAAVGSIDASLDVLGPAGLYAVRTHGSALMGILLSVLAAWIVVPLLLSAVAMQRRSVW